MAHADLVSAAEQMDDEDLAQVLDELPIDQTETVRANATEHELAALCGVAIPLILRRIRIDPALSSAVILTTVTDIVGFLSFLGLASLFLL